MILISPDMSDFNFPLLLVHKYDLSPNPNTKHVQ